MRLPAPGGCVCGAARYVLKAEPLMLYACHCSDCQKRSGSAFGLSMWVERRALSLTQGELASHDLTLDDGRASNARVCARCATRLWSEPASRPESAVLRPGTLDDTSWLEPAAHIWTRSAQPWFRFPPGVATYPTQPADYGEIAALWRKRRQA